MTETEKEFVQILCDLEVPKTVRISADGENVLYSTELSWGHRKGKHAVSTLWMGRARLDDSARSITSGEFRDYAPVWSPDQEVVAFISDRAQAGVKWAIYFLPGDCWHESEPYPITPMNKTSVISAFAFSPDGTKIAYISADEKPTTEGLPDVQPWGEDWNYARLRVVNVRTKQVRTAQLDKIDKKHVAGLCWSPDGSHIAFSTCLTPDIEECNLTGTKISTIDANFTSVEELCHFPGNVVDLTWDNDGKLYFCGGVPAGRIFAGFGLYRICRPGLAPCPYEWVTFGKEDDAIGLVKGVNGTVYVKVQYRLESRVCLLDGTVLWQEEQEFDGFDASGNTVEEFFIALASSCLDEPMEVITVAIGGEMTKVSSHGEQIEASSLGRARHLRCMSTDGDVELDALYLGPGPPSSFKGDLDGGYFRKVPTVVLIHGGPNTRISNAFNTYYYMLTPYLLALGFGILLPNYRGSSGRGQRFASYAIGGTGIHDYADVIAITQHAIDEGYADPERLLVGGFSQGGFLTNLCCVRNGSHPGGWRFRAAITGAGICDVDAMALTSDLGSSFEVELMRGRVAWNMDSHDTRNRMASALWGFKEAMERASREGKMVVPPMLILHGDADPRCPVSQSIGLRRALQSYGLPFEMVIYPGQGHIFQDQKYWIDMILRVGKWCKKYIGDGDRAASQRNCEKFINRFD